MAAPGSKRAAKANRATCMPDGSTQAVRCCADVIPTPPHCDVEGEPPPPPPPPPPVVVRHLEPGARDGFKLDSLLEWLRDV
jgi:hypothetical protein